LGRLSNPGSGFRRTIHDSGKGEDGTNPVPRRAQQAGSPRALNRRGDRASRGVTNKQFRAWVVAIESRELLSTMGTGTFAWRESPDPSVMRRPTRFTGLHRPISTCPHRRWMMTERFVRRIESLEAEACRSCARRTGAGTTPSGGLGPRADKRASRCLSRIDTTPEARGFRLNPGRDRPCKPRHRARRQTEYAGLLPSSRSRETTAWRNHLLGPLQRLTLRPIMDVNRRSFTSRVVATSRIPRRAGLCNRPGLTAAYPAQNRCLELGCATTRP
jgi:hypothetical protein